VGVVRDETMTRVEALALIQKPKRPCARCVREADQGGVDAVPACKNRVDAHLPQKGDRMDAYNGCISVR
jgi:hypothetical protein